MDNNDTFIWTDNLVQEFADWLPVDTLAGSIEINLFKESKRKDQSVIQWEGIAGQSRGYRTIKEAADFLKSQFEILQINKEKTLNVEDNHVDNTEKDHDVLTWEYFVDKPLEITSVRRLSDGEVFSIGNKIHGFGNHPIIEIQKFDIDIFNKNTIHAFGKEGYGKGINSCKKVQVLFTSVDGVDIKFMDIYYSVTDNFEIRFSNATKEIDYADRTFFKAEAAYEYVLLNKPCISLQDILDGTSHKEPPINNPQFIQLKELAKSRIRQ